MTSTRLIARPYTPPESRELINQKIQSHQWFKDSSPEVKADLLELSSDYDGFLQDLADRPDEIGELDVLRLISIAHGNFLLLPVFEVRSNITNQVFTYEYVSWRIGRFPGARTIIFLEDNGVITHFLMSKQHRFSTAEDSYESIGGTYLRIFDDKPHNLPKKIEEDICFHLGISELKFKKVVDLGYAHPDYGMSNNMSQLYAAIIDTTDLPNLTTKTDFRTTHKPVGFELQIIPITELADYVNLSEDNYFLSAVARVLASKDLDLHLDI